MKKGIKTILDKIVDLIREEKGYQITKKELSELLHPELTRRGRETAIYKREKKYLCELKLIEMQKIEETYGIKINEMLKLIEL